MLKPGVLRNNNNCLEIGFRFQEQFANIAYVRTLSQRMHQTPASDILYGPYRMDQFDPAADQINSGPYQPPQHADNCC